MSKKEFVSDVGEAISRSAYIKQEFIKGKSRNELVAELEIPYYIVYGATVNMTNDAHTGTTKGRSKKVTLIEILDTEGNVVKVDRNEAMQSDFSNGVSRKDIAAKYEVTYGTVFAATKELGGNTSRSKEIEDPNTGELKARAVFIRELEAEGKTRREIADYLKIDYAIVWAATKPAKITE